MNIQEQAALKRKQPEPGIEPGAVTRESDWAEVQAWLASILDARDCQEVIETLEARGEDLNGDVLMSLTEKVNH